MQQSSNQKHPNFISGSKRQTRDETEAPQPNLDPLLPEAKCNNTWVNGITVTQSPHWLGTCTDLSIFIDNNALLKQSSTGIIEPHGASGFGIAAQMLIDAPYFAANPLSVVQSTATVIYNPLTFSASEEQTHRYMIKRIITPLLNPKCLYHESFAMAVYLQRECKRLLSKIENKGFQIPFISSRTSQLDQFERLKGLLIKQNSSYSSSLDECLEESKPTIDLIETLEKRLKEFEVQLGHYRKIEGEQSEHSVWQDHISRIIYQVIVPRYSALVCEAFTDSHDIAHAVDALLLECDPSQTSSCPYTTALRAALSTKNGPFIAVAYWVVKCQRQFLTNTERVRVLDDERYQRVVQLFGSYSDKYVCQHYRTGNSIGLENINKRHKLLHAIESISSAGGNNTQRVAQRDGMSKSEEASSQARESAAASAIRDNIQSYFAFWIYCDLLNNKLREAGKRPLPFFHFVTDVMKYSVCQKSEGNWQQTGELDGMLLDLSLTTPQIVNIFEIKAGAEDLTGAIKQRDRFLTSMWNAFCRSEQLSFSIPAHQNWPSLLHAGQVMPNVFGSTTIDTITSIKDEVAINIARSNNHALPPFYQFIFPLVSHSAANILVLSGSYNDSGAPVSNVTATLTALQSPSTVSTPVMRPGGSIPHDICARMLGMWVFISYVIVDKEGIPIIPSHRLPGMGHFRHLLCQEAAILYAAATSDSYASESSAYWESASHHTGPVGKLMAAQKGHQDSDKKLQSQVIGPWLSELSFHSPTELASPSHCPLLYQYKYTPFFSWLSGVAVRTLYGKEQKSIVTGTVPCPQELVSALHRSNVLSSLLLIPSFDEPPSAAP